MTATVSTAGDVVRTLVPARLFAGYLLGAVVMIAGGLTAMVMGSTRNAGRSRMSPRH